MPGKRKQKGGRKAPGAGVPGNLDRPSKKRPWREVMAGTPPYNKGFKGRPHHKSISIGGATPRNGRLVRVVHISDTHGHLLAIRRRVPNGHILIHSGDATNHGRMGEVQHFKREMSQLSGYQHKLFLPGNHERGMDKRSTADIQKRLGSSCTVAHGTVRLLGLTLHFFPWGHNKDVGNMAYCINPRALGEKLKRIPEKVHVLVTHQPPKGILGGTWGSREFLGACRAKKPSCVLFGHQHGCDGIRAFGGTVYCNAAMCSHGKAMRGSLPVVIDFWLPKTAALKPAAATADAVAPRGRREGGAAASFRTRHQRGDRIEVTALRSERTSENRSFTGASIWNGEDVRVLGVEGSFAMVRTDRGDEGYAKRKHFPDLGADVSRRAKRRRQER